MMGDFYTPLTSVDRSSRLKINKEAQVLNNSLGQIHLNDVYRGFCLKTAEYTCLSGTHGTFSRINHMLGHKTSLGKFKKIETTSSFISNHNSMRLEIDHGNPIQYSCLENPMGRGTWRVTVHGAAESDLTEHTRKLKKKKKKNPAKNQVEKGLACLHDYLMLSPNNLCI